MFWNWPVTSKKVTDACITQSGGVSFAIVLSGKVLPDRSEMAWNESAERSALNIGDCHCVRCSINFVFSEHDRNERDRKGRLDEWHE